ncbi:MAG: alpha-1,2-fucosyltransferase [Dysgonamonadaceae bacterium]|jgi:hypothetical protein|nr:alpha-1,2-fucosyltransferase [Dysgonamonadaceae bacterium]
MKNNIKVFIFGGLGNQMFQYAAARTLAERLNADINIDTSLLYVHTKNTTPREYELNLFALSGNREKINSSRLRGFLLLKIYPKIKNSFPGKGIARIFHLFEDKEAFNFNPEFSSLKKNSCLFGHFQSEKYFSSCENLIREAFRFRKPFTGKNLEIAEKIKSCNAVSIHVRRGDYISNQNAAGTYAPVSTGYYEKAIKKICNRVGNPVFFIFSDEPEKAKKEINLPQAVSIDWNTGPDNYADMQLMSLCRHNIIANSSFSWWGAWLNENEEKIVIAPSTWLRNKETNRLIKDLIPEKWIRL